MKKVFKQILTWFEDTFQDGETEDWYHNKIVDSVVARYATKAELKEELSDIINSLQQEQQEVDLEKEIDNYLSCSEDIEECADNEHYYVTKSALVSMARYFFIHGRLNARKEE